MKVLRKFQRYLVSQTNSVKGELLSTELKLKMTSFGLGGCGFTGEGIDSELAPPRQVSIRLQMETGEFFEVEGKIVYLRPVPMGMSFLMNYGIEFHSKEYLNLVPIVGHLEALAQSGRMSYL